MPCQPRGQREECLGVRKLTEEVVGDICQEVDWARAVQELVVIKEEDAN